MAQMTCDRVRDEEVAERYVLGHLAVDDRDAFESHYFECKRCFTELRAVQAMSDELKRPKMASRRPVLVWAAAAAVAIATSAGVWFGVRQSRMSPPAATQTSSPPARGPSTPSIDTLSALARVEPPAYATIALRSATEDRFEAAMARYTQGDYATAAERLRAIGDADTRPPRVPFFLGASELMIGRPDAAIAALERVTTANQAAYAEHARLLLAKAWLAKGRVPEARRELNACIALSAAHAEQARSLLEQLDAATGR